jgi:pyrimidine-nucleoside phosphorylase
MRAEGIIRRKRDGEELTTEEISFFINGVVSGQVPDYQASAFLMAAYLKGMTHAETVALTRAMLESGETLDLSGLSGPRLDKHSTGGVGDKISIVLAPLMAAMGMKVPMIAGRGLCHTGGTLDKLESIPGLRTTLSDAEFRSCMLDVGFCMMGQSERLVPADRKLYALRDVTATVESIPLIAASIMSKKLAEGIEGLILDVKCGSGAFMRNIDDARKLARTLVDIGASMNVQTVALITDMDQPLGRTVGNAIEIKECLSALRGKGPDDLMELTYTLAAWALNLGDAVEEERLPMPMKDFTRRSYKHEVMEFIEKGDAFRKFVEFIDAQGGDPDVAFRPTGLPSASEVHQLKATDEGFIKRLDARAVGDAAMLLGAGRCRMEDSIDHGAGIMLLKKRGDQIAAGEPLATFYTNDPSKLKEAEDIFRSGIELSDRDVARSPLVLETLLEKT